LGHLAAGKQPVIDADRPSMRFDDSPRDSFRFFPGESSSSQQATQSQTLSEALRKDA